jgi:hypothetical protein
MPKSEGNNFFEIWRINHSNWQVLEWLLGIARPAIYLLLRGDVGDFVDSDSPLKRLAQLNNGLQRRRLLFDVVSF